ncbi:MAG: hypothetical protein KDK99_09965, partial [Verrucomicrobiales bacterium]|nr:hypothetical protein [Verrucomicrobiales bacterium]
PPPRQSLPAVTAPVTLNAGGRPALLAALPLVQGDGQPYGVLAEILQAEPRGGAAALRQLAGLLEKQALFRSGPGGVLLITSAEDGEGKSLATAALAATFCHYQRSVLILDCHTTAPGLHRYYPGSERHSSAAASLSQLRYGQSHLYVMPAHDVPAHDTSRLLDGYRAWMDRARREVDWIILDGPSILKNFTDVAPLAPLATDVLVVHDPHRASPAQLRAAMTLLQPMMSATALRGLLHNRHTATTSAPA